MKTDIQLTRDPIDLSALLSLPAPTDGSTVIFLGHVRNRENEVPISALVYEAYDAMALSELERLAHELGHAVTETIIRHRTGSIPVGEIAIALIVRSPHRAEGLTFTTRFMDRLKQDVPIWKTESVPIP